MVSNMRYICRNIFLYTADCEAIRFDAILEMDQAFTMLQTLEISLLERLELPRLQSS